ncbi:MAG: hypothetical protein KKH94_02650 [Candidatus Omnitrophica bacterium]|nr:hypothetical protein [Candidatus Omnitrophota bacterium]
MKQKNKYNWVAVMGKFDEGKNELIFKGSKKSYPDQHGKETEHTAMGLFICDRIFTGGSIFAEVLFDKICEKSACDIVLYYEPGNKYTVNAGLTHAPFCIRHFDTKWFYHAFAGEKGNLKTKKLYYIEATLNGSQVSLFVNGVEVVKKNLPYVVPQSQVGIFCVDESNITIRNFKVINKKPTAFVVMEFSSQYNDVYSEVIKNICDEQGLEVLRIDEKKGPGIIIADINKAIIEAKLIIADISTDNPNVFYEVGYAHAYLKPTVLLAEKKEDNKLPFDVSPFRTLFYENTIAGKRKLEEGLREHISAILSEKINRV